MSDRRERLLEVVKAAREMCEAATLGEPVPDKWEAEADGPLLYVVAGRLVVALVNDGSDKLVGSGYDATFIARSRTLLPALLEVVEAQIAEHKECGVEQAGVCDVLARWCAAFGVEE